MTTCEKRQVPTYPVLTSSGGRDCLPEPYKRRKCAPACKKGSPYCHGRCVYGGRACFFHPCSKTPYRTSSAETCTQLAFEAEEEVCQRSCHYSGHQECQRCIQENLPKQCGELSGSSCWHCSTPVLQESARCEIVYDDPLQVVKCVEEKQIISECTSCVCTLLCYWFPGGPQCKACLENSEAERLFNHNDKCAQGWVYSEKDKKCLKAFSKSKNWTEAALFCEAKQAILAEPNSFSMISGIVEAINLNGIYGETWIGGRKLEGEDEFRWMHAQNNQSIHTANWALEFPKIGKILNSIYSHFTNSMYSD